MKLIDADKLIEFIEGIKKEVEASRRDWTDNNFQFGQESACDNILDCIDSLQQEQPEMEFEKEIKMKWKKCNPTDEGMGLESAAIINKQFDEIARRFYELGMYEMRKRIANPYYNQKVIEKMKSEYPTDELNARKEE